MMAGAHPSEIELFEYVEEDLEEAATVTVRAHLETCPACAATVTELEQARRALRDSPLLGLPAARLDAILSTLPRQERDRPALLEFLSSPKRLAAVLAPVAAVVALVVALTTVTGKDGGEQAAAPKTTAAELRVEEAPAPLEETATAEAGAATAEAATEELPPDAGGPVPLLSVEGPAEEVARILREAGLEVTVSGNAVEVTGAKPAAVEKALRNRAPGGVPVFVLPG